MGGLAILFGVTTVVSFIFSIYVYFKTESKKVIEAANIVRQKEQLKNAHDSIVGILHSIDAIVQLPKHGEVAAAQLQVLARVARGQAHILEKRIREEKMVLSEWRFGRLIVSEPEPSEDSQ